MEALNSVFNQTYRPIQCIVIDDGSTDNTYEKCLSFTKSEDPEFSLIYNFQHKQGAQAARNLGTILSKGKYVQYLDSDDMLYTSKIELQVDYLEKNINVDAVFGDVNIGTTESHYRNRIYKSENLISQILSFEACIHTLSILYRRNSLFDNQLWDISIKKCQEIDFQIQGLIQNATYDYLPTLCGLWRTHDGPRVMSNLNILHLIEFYNKQECILSNLGQLNQDLKNKIANWYVHFYHCLKSEKIETKVILIKEIIRLNPHITFYSTKKMQLLRYIFGSNVSVYIWVRYSDLLNYLKI